MHLNKYQERVSVLTESKPVLLKTDSIADAMPGWIDALEAYKESVLNALKRLNVRSDGIIVQYWVDRESVASEALRIDHMTFGHDLDKSLRTKIERALKGRAAVFSKSVGEICAVCGSSVENIENEYAKKYRCGVHQYIDNADLCEENWEEIYGKKRAVTNNAIAALRDAYRRWSPYIQYWPHNTRRDWYERCAYQTGSVKEPHRVMRMDKVVFVGSIALRSLIRSMGDSLQSRKSLKWVGTILERVEKVYEFGVNDLCMLGTVYVITLQEHGSPFLIVSCLDAFLSINGFELRPSLNDLREALDSLADGKWEATEFAAWLSENVQKVDRIVEAMDNSNEVYV